jgi:hypothetical protein
MSPDRYFKKWWLERKFHGNLLKRLHQRVKLLPLAKKRTSQARGLHKRHTNFTKSAYNSRHKNHLKIGTRQDNFVGKLVLPKIPRYGSSCVDALNSVRK